MMTLISPALGASFLEYLVLFETEAGKIALPENENETFLYILEGSCTVEAGPAQLKRIAAGGYLFIPARHACTVTSPEKDTLVLIACLAGEF